MSTKYRGAPLLLGHSYAVAKAELTGRRQFVFPLLSRLFREPAWRPIVKSGAYPPKVLGLRKSLATRLRGGWAATARSMREASSGPRAARPAARPRGPPARAGRSHRSAR